MGRRRVLRSRAGCGAVGEACRKAGTAFKHRARFGVSGRYARTGPARVLRRETCSSVRSVSPKLWRFLYRLKVLCASANQAARPKQGALTSALFLIAPITTPPPVFPLSANPFRKRTGLSLFRSRTGKILAVV